MAATPGDTVHISAVPSPCQWINAPQSFRVTGPNSLSITAGPHTDYYHYPGGGYNTSTAPILAFTPPDPDFSLTAKIKVDFRKTFDGAALFVLTDSTQYIKFLFEKSHDGPLSVCSGVTNIYTDDSNNAIAYTNEMYYRITKAGNLLSLYYSVDGKKWKVARQVFFQPKGRLLLGFSSQSPLGTSCTGAFSDIRYSAGAK